jgi:predicted transcriptional regulator
MDPFTKAQSSSLAPAMRRTRFTASSEELDSISFKTGKTKRSLMEEAIKHLARKYFRN